MPFYSENCHHQLPVATGSSSGNDRDKSIRLAAIDWNENEKATILSLRLQRDYGTPRKRTINLFDKFNKQEGIPCNCA
jgi:hypothetical protein